MYLSFSYLLFIDFVKWLLRRVTKTVNIPTTKLLLPWIGIPTKVKVITMSR